MTLSEQPSNYRYVTVFIVSAQGGPPYDFTTVSIPKNALVGGVSMRVPVSHTSGIYPVYLVVDGTSMTIGNPASIWMVKGYK